MAQNGQQNPNAAMHVGTKAIGTSKQKIEFLTRHGVTYMDGAVPDNETDTPIRMTSHLRAFQGG